MRGLCWVHQRHSGNAKAGTLARKGTESLFIGPEPACGISEIVARSSAKVRAKVQTVHNVSIS